MDCIVNSTRNGIGNSARQSFTIGHILIVTRRPLGVNQSCQMEFLKNPNMGRKISQDSMFFDKNPKVHATSSPGSFLRSPTSLPRLFFLFYFISPETVKLWHASFLQRRPLSTQIRASIVGNKSQKNPKSKYLKKKSQKNPNCFKKSQDLGIKSQVWQHWR